MLLSSLMESVHCRVVWYSQDWGDLISSCFQYKCWYGVRSYCLEGFVPLGAGSFVRQWTVIFPGEDWFELIVEDVSLTSAITLQKPSAFLWMSLSSWCHLGWYSLVFDCVEFILKRTPHLPHIHGCHHKRMPPHTAESSWVLCTSARFHRQIFLLVGFGEQEKRQESVRTISWLLFPTEESGFTFSRNDGRDVKMRLSVLSFRFGKVTICVKLLSAVRSSKNLLMRIGYWLPSVCRVAQLMSGRLKTPPMRKMFFVSFPSRMLSQL